MDPDTAKAYQNLNKLGNVTTPFLGRTKFEPQHQGVDVANRRGTPIPAFANGTVTSISNGFKNGDNGYGNSVTVTDQSGNIHKYSHLLRPLVKLGQQIKKGQVIGQMGDTGSSYSPTGGDSSHLDYRVASKFGKMKNPLTYLKNLN